jgi:hypothetical protein
MGIFMLTAAAVVAQRILLMRGAYVALAFVGLEYPVMVKVPTFVPSVSAPSGFSSVLSYLIYLLRKRCVIWRKSN